jgi:hypothetical protein
MQLVGAVALQGGRELLASGVEHAHRFVTLHGRQPGLGIRRFDRHTRPDSIRTS